MRENTIVVTAQIGSPVESSLPGSLCVSLVPGEYQSLLGISRMVTAWTFAPTTLSTIAGP